MTFARPKLDSSSGFQSSTLTNPSSTTTKLIHLNSTSDQISLTQKRNPWARKRVTFASMPSTANSSTTNLSQQPISMIKLRERQVSEMIAGKLNDQISSETWPEASNEMIQRWKNRHPSYQTFTSHYTVCRTALALLT